MKKKLFLCGKVYDLAAMPLHVITKDVVQTVMNWIGVQIGVDLSVGTNEVEVIYHRGLKANFTPGEIHDDDWNILQGPNLVYDLNISRLPGMNYYYPVSVFEQYYNLNASAAGADKAKSIDVHETASMVKMALTY